MRRPIPKSRVSLIVVSVRSACFYLSMIEPHDAPLIITFAHEARIFLEFDIIGLEMSTAGPVTALDGRRCRFSRIDRIREPKEPNRHGNRH
jgi:hypothetical protein